MKFASKKYSLSFAFFSGVFASFEAAGGGGLVALEGEGVPLLTPFCTPVPVIFWVIGFLLPLDQAVGFLEVERLSALPSSFVNRSISH